jgi:hypothetical protein
MPEKSSPSLSTRPDQIVIALMGMSGSGKSSFIKEVTNCPDIAIGHDLTSGKLSDHRWSKFYLLISKVSETEQVEQYEFHHRGMDYVLIDTPGFDDTYEGNEVIVSRIKEWLSSSFGSGTRLNAIIYLHRITDTRVTGTSSEFLRTFHRICGEQGLKNVILATSFWDDISSVGLGERREKDLTNTRNFWAQMIGKGSKVFRLKPGVDSKLKLLEHIASNCSKITLQMQTEAAAEGHDVRYTSEGRDRIAAFEKEMAEKTEMLRKERLEVERKNDLKYQKERRKRQLEEQSYDKEVTRLKGNLQAQQARVEGELRRQARRRREEELEQQMSKIRIDQAPKIRHSN